MVGGQPRDRIAAVDASTGVVTGWTPVANGSVNSIAVSGSTVFAGGDFTSIGGQARNRIAALDDATGLATSWNPDANSQVLSLDIEGTTLYAAGGFTSIGGVVRNRIAAVDTPSGTVLPWDPDVDYTVNSVSVDGATVYLGGSFAHVGGQVRHGIAAVDAVTADPTPWNPNADLYVDVVAARGGVVYAGGQFVTIGGQVRLGLAALDAMTGIPTAWYPADRANYNRVLALTFDEQSVYAGGWFQSMGMLPASHIAAISQVALDVPAQGPPIDGASLRVWPNPTHGAARIEYALARPSLVRIRVLDLQGREVARPVERVDTAGRHEAKWNARGDARLAPGLYFVRMGVNGRNTSVRVAVLH